MREKGVRIEETQNRDIWRRLTENIDSASAGKVEVNEEEG